MAALRDLERKAVQRVGQVLRNKWRVERLLQVGGMAAVYEATHRNGNRVAIKILHPTFSKDAENRERFLREGYAANKVGHAGAVTVLDDDELEDGAVFLVMELLEGGSLQARLDEKGTLDAPEVLIVAERVLDVLGAAHAKDIIHRDIKPGNIFLSKQGEVKVLDFGLARVRERAFKGTMTRTGMVLGTVTYMPPEQARGKHDAVDHRSDLWAVGATMFKALSGKYVHEGGGGNERLIAAMSQPARSLASVAPALPAPLVAFVDRALAFQKYDRWPDARSMQRELHRVYQALTGAPVPAAQRVFWNAAWVPTERNPKTGPDAEDIHVSVVIDAPDSQSIVVEFEGDGGGVSERVTLKRTDVVDPEADEEPLSDVTVVEVPIAPPPKPKPKPRA